MARAGIDFEFAVHIAPESRLGKHALDYVLEEMLRFALQDLGVCG